MPSLAPRKHEYLRLSLITPICFYHLSFFPQECLIASKDTHLFQYIFLRGIHLLLKYTVIEFEDKLLLQIIHVWNISASEVMKYSLPIKRLSCTVATTANITGVSWRNLNLLSINFEKFEISDRIRQHCKACRVKNNKLSTWKVSAESREGQVVPLTQFFNVSFL